jgi:hypothetical protein
VAEKESEGFFTEGAIMPCAVCGDKSMRPSMPETEIPLPGVGVYSGDAMYLARLRRQIVADACPFVVQAVLDRCTCSQSSAVVNETKLDRDPSEGLFRLTANSSVIEEPWDGGPYSTISSTSVL